MACTWLKNFYLLCVYAAIFGICVGKDLYLRLYLSWGLSYKSPRRRRQVSSRIWKHCHAFSCVIKTMYCQQAQYRKSVQEALVWKNLYSLRGRSGHPVPESHSQTRMKTMPLFSTSSPCTTSGKEGGFCPRWPQQWQGQAHDSQRPLCFQPRGLKMKQLFKLHRTSSVGSRVLSWFMCSCFFPAAYVSLCAIILIEFLGLEKLSNSFGFLNMFRGIATFIGAPVAGTVQTFVFLSSKLQ